MKNEEKSRKSAMAPNNNGGHLVFQNEPKNITRQDILRLKIPGNLKVLAIILKALEGVTVKSLHTTAAAA